MKLLKPLNPLRIGIDLDGVLVHQTEAWINKLHEMTGHWPEGWDFEKDPNCWNWPTEYGYSEETLKDFYKFSNSNGDFWLNMNPWASLTDLEAVSNAIDKHSVYFITNRPMEVAKHSDKWVRKHFGNRNFATMHARHKGPVVYGLQLHCLIDDRPENLKEVLEYCGLTCMPFLLDRPWNREFSNPYIIRVKTIKEALDKLGQKVVECQ